MALLLAAGLVACTDDDGDANPTLADNTTTATAAPAGPGRMQPATDNTGLEAAFEFAACMRDNGIEDFLDPQILPTATTSSNPPLASGMRSCRRVRRRASTSSAHRAPPPLRRPMTSPLGGSGSCPAAIVSARTAPSSASGCVRRTWTRSLFYLQDGGACFSAETCAPDSDLYRTTVDEGPGDEGGIFDFADARNPFADYSVVYVPYCTGDVHLGNTTTEYAPGLTVQHKGYVNGIAALDHLAATFPGATEVVVVGESAGSIAVAAVWRTRLGSASRRQDHRARGRLGLVPRRAPRQRNHRCLGHRHDAIADWPNPATSSSGAFRGCSSRVDDINPTSSSPATTTPTTRPSRPGTRSPPSPRRTSCH